MKIMKTIFTITITALFAVGLLTVAVSGQQIKQLEVKIYLQRTIIEANGNNSDVSAFVKRKVDAKSPLRPALEWLFSP